MQTMLAPGDLVELSTYRMRCRVESFLGGGGQGEVYQVLTLQSGPDRRLALKWYHPHMATAEQRAILHELVEQEPPSPRFLWPLDLATMAKGPGFGYVMPLRRSEFHGLFEVMTCAVSPSFRALATTGMQLADGFWQLHAAGLCYRDISFGNVFFDPGSGDALICDNDNVGIEGRSAATVRGTLGFMAPEIMRGEAMPSAVTDLFSLAVLLFHLFMVHHPLLGRRELDEPCLDGPAAYRLYGQHPVFIFDPDDRSNEPVAGYHDNALIFWPLYPRFIRDLFVRAFTDGLRDPVNGRIRETEWRLALVRLRDAIVYCGSCRAENFWDEAKGTAPTCWSCGRPVRLPPRLRIDADVLMLNYDTRIFPHHVRGERFVFDQPVAEVVRHPTNPDVWGLKNLTEGTWSATTASGTRLDVPTGRSVTLAAGTRVDFGMAQGTIEF
jgi:eukaryotic-like serine/threonine-protein kinase